MSLESSKLSSIVTPFLAVNRDSVHRNLNKMMSIAGGARRLRPHVKTHKSSDVVALQCGVGIRSFKAATLSEVRMAIGGGAEDIVLAHPAMGAKAEALIELRRQYPRIRVSTLVDSVEGVRQFGSLLDLQGPRLELWIDIDCGMHRTGISFDRADGLAKAIRDSDTLQLAGLHVYDGHLHQPSWAERERAVTSIFQDVLVCCVRNSVDRVIVGGSPTFAIWCQRCLDTESEIAWEFSPGTTLYWDAGYAERFPDLGFEMSTCVVATVVSHPDNGKEHCFCLDAGTKSIASEMPIDRRVRLSRYPSARLLSQSEEHLVFEVSEGPLPVIGELVSLQPHHICPTVARFHEAIVVDDESDVIGRWPIAIRHGG